VLFAQPQPGSPVAAQGNATPVLATLQPPETPSVPPADPWGFEEDEPKVETWGDILRPQALDISLTAAFLAFAMFSFVRKSRPLKYVALALSVAYLGVTKSQLVSITDLFRVVDWSFPTVKDGVNWYLFTGFTIVSTVLFGRVYCGRICAFGAFTQLMDAALPRRWRMEPPKWLERRAVWVKYGLLAATVAYYLLTRHFAVYRYVEPFWMYTRSADVVLWSMLGVLLVATVFVRNLYCRFLCPVGATLGILSTLTVFRIKRWSECSTCRICEKTCEWGAIDGPTIVKTECVRCDDCERVYADEQKCPHWLIPVVRGRKLAAAVAAGQPAPRFIPLTKA
jgi:polyferredoxin